MGGNGSKAANSHCQVILRNRTGFPLQLLHSQCWHGNPYNFTQEYPPNNALPQQSYYFVLRQNDSGDGGADFSLYYQMVLPGITTIYFDINARSKYGSTQANLSARTVDRFQVHDCHTLPFHYLDRFFEIECPRENSDRPLIGEIVIGYVKEVQYLSSLSLTYLICQPTYTVHRFEQIHDCNLQRSSLSTRSNVFLYGGSPNITTKEPMVIFADSSCLHCEYNFLVPNKPSYYDGMTFKFLGTLKPVPDIDGIPLYNKFWENRSTAGLGVVKGDKMNIAFKFPTLTFASRFDGYIQWEIEIIAFELKKVVASTSLFTSFIVPHTEFKAFSRGINLDILNVLITPLVDGTRDPISSTQDWISYIVDFIRQHNIRYQDSPHGFYHTITLPDTGKVVNPTASFHLEKWLSQRQPKNSRAAQLMNALDLALLTQLLLSIGIYQSDGIKLHSSSAAGGVGTLKESSDTLNAGFSKKCNNPFFRTQEEVFIGDGEKEKIPTISEYSFLTWEGKVIDVNLIRGYGTWAQQDFLNDVFNYTSGSSDIFSSGPDTTILTPNIGLQGYPLLPLQGQGDSKLCGLIEKIMRSPVFSSGIEVPNILLELDYLEVTWNFRTSQSSKSYSVLQLVIFLEDEGKGNTGDSMCAKTYQARKEKLGGWKDSSSPISSKSVAGYGQSDLYPVNGKVTTVMWKMAPKFNNRPILVSIRGETEYENFQPFVIELLDIVNLQEEEAKNWELPFKLDFNIETNVTSTGVDQHFDLVASISDKITSDIVGAQMSSPTERFVQVCSSVRDPTHLQFTTYANSLGNDSIYILLLDSNLNVTCKKFDIAVVQSPAN